MKVNQLAILLRKYAKHHDELARSEHAAALNKLAAVLDKLPKGDTVSKALKKPK